MDESQDDINTESLGSKENKWIGILKDLKEKQVRSSNDPNIPVTTYAGKDDKYIIASMPISKEVSNPKYYGLEAAAILKRSFDPDLIVFISDAYWADDTRITGKSLAELFREGHPKVHEGLTCVSINRDKKVVMTIVPYYYGGSNIIIWGEGKSSEINTGLIPKSLLKIMDMQLIIDHPFLKTIEMSREKCIYHTVKAAIQLLRDKGFTVNE